MRGLRDSIAGVVELGRCIHGLVWRVVVVEVRLWTEDVRDSGCRFGMRYVLRGGKDVVQAL